MGKIVGVVSLKGGVGKTSSVVSLGASLSQLGKKVLLVDANFSAPNLGMHLNLVDPSNTLHQVLAGDLNIGDAVYSVGELDVLPCAIFPKQRIEPLKLRDKIKSLRRKYDIILLDSSPSLNEETLAVILAADELLVVTTPDYPTLSMTLKAIKLAKQRGTPISGLILNKVYNKNFELSLKDIERTSDVPVMAVIPHDVNVSRSQSKFIPSPHYKPWTKGNMEYKNLAAVLVGEKLLEDKGFKKMFNKLTPKKQEINRQIFYQAVFG